MDSLSVDNEEPDFSNLLSSTPKHKNDRNNNDRRRKSDKPSSQITTPKKSKLECSYCKKTYVSQYHFNKHIRAHKEKEDDTNISLPVHLDVTNDVNFSMLQGDSSQGTSTQQQFVTPKPPAPKKPLKTPKAKPSFMCTYCLKGYVSHSSYQTHMRNHAIQDGAARLADKQQIMNKGEEISQAALIETSKARAATATGDDFRQLLTFVLSASTSQEWAQFSNILCENLVDSISEKKCLLPSALLTTLLRRQEHFLSNGHNCENLLKILHFPANFEDDMKFQFLLEFSLHMVKEILCFISKTFRSSHRDLTKEYNIDKEDRQVVYYIGGSIIRGYFRIHYRYKGSHTWQLIAETLRSQVLCDKDCVGDLNLDDDAAWTMSVDRGGLLYPNELCQKFFIKLTEIVFSHEQNDGSINYDLVLRSVSNSDVSILWDEMICDSLPEAVSINLMNDVILSYCRTCGRGFAKRRLNFLRERPVIAMNTRHLVARRKKN